MLWSNRKLVCAKLSLSGYDVGHRLADALHKHSGGLNADVPHLEKVNFAADTCTTPARDAPR